MLITDNPEADENAPAQPPCSDIELRLQVLHLAKDVFTGKSCDEMGNTQADGRYYNRFSNRRIKKIV